MSAPLSLRLDDDALQRLYFEAKLEGIPPRTLAQLVPNAQIDANRTSSRGILPDDILDRRKKGFGIPRYYLKDLAGGKTTQEHVLRTLFLQT